MIPLKRFKKLLFCGIHNIHFAYYFQVKVVYFLFIIYLFHAETDYHQVDGRIINSAPYLASNGEMKYVIHRNNTLVYLYPNGVI